MSSSEFHDIQLDQLTSEVHIVRDRWGIPHIFAENQHDLFFAYGLAMAQETTTGSLTGVVVDRDGRVIFQKDSQEEAPSMDAAS